MMKAVNGAYYSWQKEKMMVEHEMFEANPEIEKSIEMLNLMEGDLA
jgi:hypothetical protein